MASVEDRIVRIEFDNSSFERKIQSTITSLGQLDKALKMENAQKGLTDVSAAAGKVDVSHISRGIEGVSKSFMALSTIAITALSGITSKAISVGTQLVKSLSLDQITAGFKDYELKIGATQTIMAGTGEGVASVTKNLKDLDVYADKTIYSLSDMVGNISKFTNAGVKLPVATKSMIGIANAAALAGANSEEASRAMYNLGQAIGQGTVRLIDWKSVELANMGTMEFKQQLIDSGVAMGTLKKQTDGTIKTLKGTKVDVKNFSTTLQDQWLTSAALTRTLEAYGSQTTAIGKKAWAAAQDVKSFSMMSETLKASISTGWTDTFDIVIGNISESKKLFTGLTNTIGNFFGKMADRRNEMLAGWKAFGGRTTLLNGLKTAFINIGKIIAPIQKAFKEIFPPMTVKRLLEMTLAFENFAKSLAPSAKTLTLLHRIFKGFFAVLSIGWTVIKEGVRFLFDLGKALTGSVGPGFAEFAAKIADVFTELQAVLVKGGGVKAFFDKLLTAITAPIPFVDKLKNAIMTLFGAFSSDAPKKASDNLGRVGDRFKNLQAVLDRLKAVWAPIQKGLMKVLDILKIVGKALGKFFSALGGMIADALDSGQFKTALDALNVAILGGIGVLLAKLIKTGFNFKAVFQSSFDVGGGMFSKIGKSFDELTKTMGVMQTKIKAEALQKIAIAIGILTVSVVALSLIDSVALTKALTAMSVGFGQLLAAMAIITKVDTGMMDAAKFTAMSIGMTVMAGAILILAGAAKTLSGLSWGELATGLTGVAVLLAMVVGVVKILQKDQASFIAVGLGLVVVATSLSILAGVVKIFAMLSWAEMAQGMAGVAAAIGIMVGAIRLMPEDSALKAAGLLLVAGALAIIAGAIARFAAMSVGDVAKGLVTMAAALVLIGLAMEAFPIQILLIGPGLVAVGVALVYIAKAVGMMGKMSWAEIGKGLTVLAASLIVLAIGAQAMVGAIPGAIAMGIMAASLLLLGAALKVFASISWGDLLHGLIAVAAALAVLAIAAYLITPALPAMMGLGIALMLIGGGFALFGAAAFMVAKAFEALAKAGEKGSRALVNSLKAIGEALPALAAGFAKGVIDFIMLILDAGPKIVAGLGKLLGLLIDELIKLVPKLGLFISKLLTEIIRIVSEFIPQYIRLGIGLILSFLQAIRDAIPQIVTVVGEIITGFLDAMTEQVPSIVDSLIRMITEIMTSVAEGLGKLSSTLYIGLGKAFIDGFLEGLNQQFPGLLKWFTELPGKILDLIKSLFGIKSPSKKFKEIGINIIQGLIDGLNSMIGTLFRWFTSLGGKILGWIGNAARILFEKGADFIRGLFSGITAKIKDVNNWFLRLPGAIKGWISNSITWLVDVGKNIIQGLWNGITSVWDKMTSWVGDKIKGLKDKLKAPWKLLSPSHVTREWGQNIIDGLWVGMKDVWGPMTKWLSSVNDPDQLINSDAVNTSFQKIVDQLGDIEEFNPTITPVLDLTRVAEDASKITDYISASTLSPALSQARLISADTNAIKTTGTTESTATAGQVSFQQNIYAPEQLSTADIYKQTRNQITMAKRELSIP